MENGSQLVLLTHKMPPDYIDLFSFSDEVELISNPVRFQLRVLHSAFKGQADLVYAPGPHILKDSLTGLAKTLLVLANIALIRSTGGVVQTAGRALRGSGRIAARLERKLVASSKLYVVRDAVSGSIAKANLSSAPDLAFGREIVPRTDKRLLISCSFRNDTPVNTATFGHVVRELKDSGFEVVLVSQVRRDDAQHERLAQEFDLRAFLWKSKTHSEQQDVVDSTYAASHAVISNRLHGLIFGITSGAVPVEYRIGSSDKIRSTLAPWFESVPVIRDDRSDAFSVDVFEQNTEYFNDTVLNVRSQVNEVLEKLSDRQEAVGIS